MEARIIASEMLGKCGVFLYQLTAEIEAFYLHLFATTYVERSSSAGKEYCWTVVLTMSRVIWREMKKA